MPAKKSKKPEARKLISFYAYLQREGACKDALLFVKGRSADEAWRDCPHPEWRAWLADGFIKHGDSLSGVGCRSCEASKSDKIPAEIKEGLLAAGVRV